MEICCFPQSISTYFYKFQSISIILSPYHSYLLIPFLTLLIYSLNGYKNRKEEWRDETQRFSPTTKWQKR
ncbi:MAG: hypothetical protein AB1422_01610 [bacterium]